MKKTVLIGNSNSLLVHKPTCAYLKVALWLDFIKSKEEALRKGYVPCRRCKPFPINLVAYHRESYSKLRKEAIVVDDVKTEDFNHYFALCSILFTDLDSVNKVIDNLNIEINILKDYYEGKVDYSAIAYSLLQIRLNAAFLYITRGFQYSLRGQYDRSFNDFEEAMIMNPTLLRPMFRKKEDDLLRFKSMGLSVPHINYYTQKIKETPNNAFLYACRGFYYFGGDRNSDALDDFEKAISLDDKMPFAYFMRGRTGSRGVIRPDSKTVVAALVEDYDKAISLKPDSAIYYVSKVYLYRKIKDVKNSIDNLKKAVSLKSYRRYLSAYDYDSLLNGLLLREIRSDEN